MNNTIADIFEDFKSNSEVYKANQAIVRGKIEEDLKFSHALRDESFYETKIRATRISGIDDVIPIIIPEFYAYDIKKGQHIEIIGQFRSKNCIDQNGKKRLKLFLFAKYIVKFEDQSEDYNSIFLQGYVCKKPICRETPFGKEITDLFIAINRPNNKTDYIPCIVWWKNEIIEKNLHIGDEISLIGRIQSRKYFKRFSQDSEEGEWREAYEVSANKIKKI